MTKCAALLVYARWASYGHLALIEGAVFPCFPRQLVQKVVRDSPPFLGVLLTDQLPLTAPFLPPQSKFSRVTYRNTEPGSECYAWPLLVPVAPSMYAETPYHPVKIFEANTQGRDFVVGDIHGHFEHLATVLKGVNFNPLLDRLFSVGDIIDRGPCSVVALSWLALPWFHAVRGNHEEAAVECAAGTGDVSKHKRTGGSWLYDLPKPAQAEIITELEKLPYMIEVSLPDGQKIGIVHAQAPATTHANGWEEAKAVIGGQLGAHSQLKAIATSLHARSKLSQRDQEMVGGLNMLYVGHSTVAEVTLLGNVAYIDTGCSFDDGALTLVELTTGAITTVYMRGTPNSPAS